jgi:hypothetical protein
MSQYYQYDTSRTARHFNFYVSSKYQCNGLWFDPTGARIYDLPRMRVWSDRGSNLRSTAHEGLIRQGLESTIYRTWGFDPTGARISDLPHMRVWSDRGSNLRSTAHEGLIRQGLESTIYRTWGFDQTGARISDLPHMRVWSDRGSNLRSTAHEGLIRHGFESTIYRKWGFGPTGAHFWWWVKGRQNMRTGFFTHISRQNSGGLSVFKQYFTSEQFAGWFALFHQHSSDGGYFR